LFSFFAKNKFFIKGHGLRIETVVDTTPQITQDNRIYLLKPEAFKNGKPIYKKEPPLALIELPVIWNEGNVYLWAWNDKMPPIKIAKVKSKNLEEIDFFDPNLKWKKMVKMGSHRFLVTGIEWVK